MVFGIIPGLAILTAMTVGVAPLYFSGFIVVAWFGWAVLKKRDWV